MLDLQRENLVAVKPSRQQTFLMYVMDQDKVCVGVLTNLIEETASWVFHYERGCLCELH